jgi:hypothetical protein
MFMNGGIEENPTGLWNLGLADQRGLRRDQAEMINANKVARHFDKALGHRDDAQVYPELPWS